MIALKNSLQFLAVIALLAILGCAATPKKDATLYQALGEYAGIEQLVRELIFVLAQDERVKPRYKGVNMQRFKKGLSDYICVLAAGPCEYQGDSIQVVHAGHNYTNKEFNALVEDLILAMEKQKIPVTVQNQLLALLAPSYEDVVYQ